MGQLRQQPHYCGTANCTTATQNDQDRDQDLKRTVTFQHEISCCSIHWTYPLKEEQCKGKNHWRILAVVQFIHVGLICIQVGGPRSPGTEDDHGAPNGHHTLDEDHGHRTKIAEADKKLNLKIRWWKFHVDGPSTIFPNRYYSLFL